MKYPFILQIFILKECDDLHINYSNIYCYINRLGGVMVSVLALSVVDRGFEHRSVQTKYYKIGMLTITPPRRLI
jgi:hypothetical protein